MDEDVRTLNHSHFSRLPAFFLLNYVLSIKLSFKIQININSRLARYKQRKDHEYSCLVDKMETKKANIDNKILHITFDQF